MRSCQPFQERKFPLTIPFYYNSWNAFLILTFSFHREQGILSDEQAREVEQLLNKKTIFVETLETNFENDSTTIIESTIEISRSEVFDPSKLDTNSLFDDVLDRTFNGSTEKTENSKLAVDDKPEKVEKEYGESGDLSPPQVLEDTSGELVAIGYPPVPSKEVFVNQDGVHFFEDGNFWMEVPGLVETDQEEDDIEYPVIAKKKTKLKFSTSPIQVFSTFSVTDYDRRNEDVDPVAASAEYELEKRVEKMDVFPVELMKGPEGLGLSIIGES